MREGGGGGACMCVCVFYLVSLLTRTRGRRRSRRRRSPPWMFAFLDGNLCKCVYRFACEAYQFLCSIHIIILRV